MREIKFRQWTRDRFYHWGVGVDGCTFTGPVSGSGITAQNTVHQQFTGLRDKNGKEIYEGDVVKLHYVSPLTGVVSYDSTDGGYRLLDTEAPTLVYHTSSEGMREVIGNIYENPELLEAPCAT